MKIDKRFDNKDHWLENSNRKSRSLCKNHGCKSLTKVICTKCKISLCFSKKWNCFRQFHTPSTSNSPQKKEKKISNEKSTNLVNTVQSKTGPTKTVFLIGKKSLRKRIILSNVDRNSAKETFNMPISIMEEKINFMNALSLRPNYESIGEMEWVRVGIGPIIH